MIGPFDYNSNLTPEGRLAIEAVREGYKQLSNTLARYCHESRELDLALTNLETSAMWAIKGITHN